MGSGRGGAAPDGAPGGDLRAAPRGLLADALREVEEHVHADGWDRPPRLFALVRTADLLAAEPGIAGGLGGGPGPDAGPGALTCVDQELPGDVSLDELLPRLAWPDQVAGCALVLERLVLPAGAEGSLPAGPRATPAARRDPAARDVRIAVAVLRDGTRAHRLRLRGHDEVLSGDDLVPDLADALVATFDPD